MTSIYRARCRIALIALGLALPQLPAEEEKKAIAGWMDSEAAIMVRREAKGQPWQIVKHGEALHAGDLALGLSGAGILSANKAVQLTLLSDFTGKSPYPIFESGVRFPATADGKWDLEFTLDRGRVDLINRKEKGAARVKVMVDGQPWELTLQEPGARMGMELFGRWARGVPFTPKPGAKDVPNLNMVVLALKGETDVRVAGQQVNMYAPPGPALLQWDNVAGVDPTPQKLETLPEWALGDKPSPLLDKVNAIRKEMRDSLATKSIDELLDEAVNSDDPLKRRLAIFMMGALDDLPRLAAALSTTKHADVWDNGVLALRHWIGRGPGQDTILYRGLIERRKLTPIQAEMVLSLLHSFGEDDLARPETYELLIRYLDHNELAIRGLANWHLKRLVREGKDIGYDPLAAKEERDKAVKKWRKLVPTGELPPGLRPKKDKKDK